MTYSYEWPVEPPPGFETWHTDPEVHNRWMLKDNTPHPLVYLTRRCRNEEITFTLHLSPHFVRLREIAHASTSHFAPVQSPRLNQEGIVAWWVTLLLTRKVPV